MTPAAPSTRVGSARAAARAEMTEAIKQAARARLASDGPDLSLRAVARDIGVVSSAVYRYYASRDELLTALIIDAYNSLGDATDAAEGAVARADLLGRWSALGRSLRGWALQHRHEYALIYGSPVPGYAAPQDTVDPAGRPVLVLLAILRDGVARGQLSAGGQRIPRTVRADLERILEFPGWDGLPPAVLLRGMTAFTGLVGTLSFELFGRLQGGITDYDEYFEFQLRVLATHLGLR